MQLALNVLVIGVASFNFNCIIYFTAPLEDIVANLYMKCLLVDAVAKRLTAPGEQSMVLVALATASSRCRLGRA